MTLASDYGLLGAGSYTSSGISYNPSYGQSVIYAKDLEPDVEQLKTQNRQLQEVIDTLVWRIAELEMHMEYLKFKP